MECYYGDAFLYKVEKHHLEEDGKNANFKVISVCNNVDVVNKFIDEYLPHISNLSPVVFLSPFSLTISYIYIGVIIDCYFFSFVLLGVFSPSLSTTRRHV
jgi:hypothetical protein